MPAYISHMSAASQLWPPTPAPAPAPAPWPWSSSWLRSILPLGSASVCRLIGRIVWVTDWTTYWCIGRVHWMTVLAESCRRPNVTNINSHPGNLSSSPIPASSGGCFITLNALHVHHLGCGIRGVAAAGNGGRQQTGRGGLPFFGRGARAGTSVPLMQRTHSKRISHAIQSISLCQSQSFCHGLRVRLMRMDDVAEVAGFLSLFTYDPRFRKNKEKIQRKGGKGGDAGNFTIHCWLQ